jgi:competence protein ComEA
MRDIFIYALIVVNLFILVTVDYSNNKKSDLIGVEVKGYVNNPGVYLLEQDSLVEDLIVEAGGLSDNADISVINLARKLSDEDVVIIYSNEEIEEMRQGSTSVKYIDKECVCPIIDNSALFNEVITNAEGIIIDTGKISLNSATIEELMTLPGIGESKAKLIIEYRNTNKGFKEIEEIKNVKGIGNSIYEKIKDFLTL